MIIKRVPKALRWACSFTAITLGPLGIFYTPEKLGWETINHEMIHWQQQKEMLFIFFYVWYLIEWLIRIPINGRKAYISISFEREGYANRSNGSYLNNRRRFAWTKYLTNKSK